VIAEADRVSVRLHTGETIDAEPVGADLSTDLALLRLDDVPSELPALALGDSDAVEVGDPVIAIGNPFGVGQTTTTGIVSALERRILAPSGDAIEGAIQTDAAINPGNSGGPLLDAQGRVIGINTLIASGGGNGSVGIGFAIPINMAKTVIGEIG
jgi:S1-C subfamily serine protease